MLEADIRGLYVQGRDEPVLRDIRFTLKPGEMVALLGASDSGKSLLCRCLAGTWREDSGLRLDGEVRVDGRDLSRLPLSETFGLVSLVVDDFQNQLFCSSVWEDLAFGPGQLGLTAEETWSRSAASLATVGLAGFEQRSNRTLSGGETQRAVLASYLSIKAPYLILDRAAAQIDEAGRRAIYRQLAERCRDDGLSLLVVDDRIEEIAAHAHRALVLDGGRLVHDGEPGAARAILASRTPNSPIPRTRPEPPWADQPLIEVRNISHGYPGSDFRLTDISLAIHPGEWLTVTGPNGAGKSTFIKHLNGLLLPHEGRVLVGGRDTRRTKMNILADTVGYVSQNPANQLFADSVEEEIGFNLKIRGYSRDEIRSRVADLLNQWSLAEYARVHPGRLQPSIRQKVALVSCLAHGPRVVILDEPLSSLSHPRNLEVLEDVARLNAEGMTVIFVTHDPALVAPFSHRRIAMSGGRMVNEGGE